jgi:adenosylmethionine-8-amino-7-oxononanoate aminotransferase
VSRILHRNLRTSLPFAASASRVAITDAQGKSYIDASGGAAVSCLGHAHPDVLAAMHAQIDKVAYTHTSFFTTEVAEALAEALVAKAPAGIGFAYLVSGGSEAMEAALKMARQYFVEVGEPGREVFIGRRQSYHGNTLGALAVGGNEARRRVYAPLLIDVARVAPCYEYRDRHADETREAYSERLATELEETIERLGPQRVIGFCVETVAGATLGAAPPTPGYFRRVREICDRHGVLLIADEVMCGMGRTGTLHAIEQEGVAPDLMTIAKGLGGGYQAIGAVLASTRIVEALRACSGAFKHGHTYIGHPVACAAALAVQRVIERDGLLEQVRARGRYLARRLCETLGERRFIGDIRGRGLFMALELVADRVTKRPFDPSLQVHARVKAAAMERGLLVYPMGGTIDGVAGDHVLLAPPYIASETDLDAMVERLAAAIDSLELR